jgi:hypothetical protein
MSRSVRPRAVDRLSILLQLEEWCRANGRPTTDVKMLRIDQLAELGCCECGVRYLHLQRLRGLRQAASARSFTCACWDPINFVTMTNNRLPLVVFRSGNEGLSTVDMS